ncbi:MAG TPA: DNA polymerase III subunit gamma/tau, partial [Candidatus Fimicola cottocaccae]|nr:DNA polymerase III subunit gamma/tau [Candidatus Fimicola cottocaccae]
TSTAKIFAKAINCENPIDGEPCGKCNPCTAIAEGRSVNVIEIDAASNNSVDNIREIREEVKYPPTEGKYKVYIIDEVHMLSQGAFNALLKTLEEPPAHVIFILATTDPQKVPVTILSRCQRFDFRRITSDDIVSTLSKYLENENVQADEDALRYISHLADGSMRDSLSILDQCLSFFYGETITLEKVIDISGAVDTTVFFKTADAIFNKDAKKLMDIVDEVVMEGRDVKQFVSELINHFRNLLVAISVDNPSNILDMSTENIKELKNQSNNTSADELIYLIKTFSTLSNEIKYSDNERILLEVMFIKLCTPSAEKSYDGLLARISAIERAVKDGIKVSATIETPVSKPVKKTKTAPKPKAESEDFKRLRNMWLDFCENFKMPLRGILLKSELRQKDSDTVYISCEKPFERDMVKNSLNIIKDILDEKTGKEFELATITESEYKRWHDITYGVEESQSPEDEDWESLMSNVFPDADFL